MGGLFLRRYPQRNAHLCSRRLFRSVAAWLQTSNFPCILHLQHETTGAFTTRLMIESLFVVDDDDTIAHSSTTYRLALSFQHMYTNASTPVTSRFMHTATLAPHQP